MSYQSTNQSLDMFGIRYNVFPRYNVDKTHDPSSWCMTDILTHIHRCCLCNRRCHRTDTSSIYMCHQRICYKMITCIWQVRYNVYISSWLYGKFDYIYMLINVSHIQ